MRQRVKKAGTALVMIFAMLITMFSMPTTKVQAAKSDFVINERGTLVEYKGKGGDVVIPDGVKSIGYKVFYQCDKLKSVKIPSSVEVIGDSAFYDCTSLTTVTMSSNLKVIGEYAFSGCKSLTSLTLPSGLVEIGEGAFCGCDKLKSVKIPSSVEVIGERAFAGCESLTTVTLPSGLKEIKRDTFMSCGKLKSIKIPSSVEVIGEDAFCGCESLTTVTLPSGLKEIGVAAFANTGLKSVKIPGSVQYIGRMVFSETPLLKEKQKERKDHLVIVDNWLIDASMAQGNVVIPEGVTKIAERVFGHNESVSSVTVPSTVKEWDGAFSYYEGLTQVTIKSGIKKIGASAFAGCEKLTTVTIPSGVKEIGESAFNGCKNLKKVKITSGVKSIGKEAFAGCEKLEKVTIPSSVKTYGEDPFEDTPWLEKKRKEREDHLVIIHHILVDGYDATGAVEIPDGVTKIAECAFGHAHTILGSGRRYASLLTSVTIPSSVKEIEACAFRSCRQLKKVTMQPNPEREIDVTAFVGTSWLETQRNSAGLIIIDNKLIDGMEAKGKVIIPDGVTEIVGSAFVKIGRSFVNEIPITSVTIPSSVKKIGASAFYECPNLETVNLSEGLVEISDNAFCRCVKLKRLRIPTTVEKVGKRAFEGCDRVEIPKALKGKIPASAILYCDEVVYY